jgi:hypothetical protein
MLGLRRAELGLCGAEVAGRTMTTVLPLFVLERLGRQRVECTHAIRARREPRRDIRHYRRSRLPERRPSRATKLPWLDASSTVSNTRSIVAPYHDALLRTPGWSKDLVGGWSEDSSSPLAANLWQPRCSSAARPASIPANGMTPCLAQLLLDCGIDGCWVGRLDRVVFPRAST